MNSRNWSVSAHLTPPCLIPKSIEELLVEAMREPVDGIGGDFVLCYLAQQPGEVSLGIESVQVAGTDNGVQASQVLGCVIGSGKEVVFAT